MSVYVHDTQICDLNLTTCNKFQHWFFLPTHFNCE